MEKKSNSGLKFLIAYLFFLSATTVRFFFESHFASLVDKQNLIFHHHFWFLFAFLLFLINFKYFLKLPPSKTWWISFLSPALFIPLIYNLIVTGGKKVQFNYLSAADFPQYIKGIASFMLFSKQNRPIAIELIIITFSIFLFSYFITRKPVRSILCALSCYLSLMLLAGTVWIAPHEPDFTMFFVASSMKLQNFMSFLFFFAAEIAVIILFFKEIIHFLSEKRRLFLFIILFTFFITGFQFLLKDPTFADRILMIPHSILFSFFIVILVFVRKNIALKILFLTITLVSSGILYQLFFSPIEQKNQIKRTASERELIEQKVNDGLNILSENQEKNGEFSSLSCQSAEKKNCSPHSGSVFVSTFILYSLKHASNKSVAKTIIKKGTDFVRSKKESGDLWRFWGDKIDHDLDDTSCSSFILKSNGENLSNKDKIYDNRDEQGLFKTWIRNSEENDIDGVVNANVLLYAGENENTIAACNYIIDSIIENREADILYYYPEPATLYYTISRAYFEKSMKCVERGIPYIVKKAEAMLNNMKKDDDLMNRSLLLNTLLNFNQNSNTMKNSLVILLNTDFDNAALGSSPFFVAGEPPEKPFAYYFSRETAIALIVEFLSRYEKTQVR